MPPAPRGSGLPSEPAADPERPVQIVVATRPSDRGTGGPGVVGGAKRAGVLILIVLVLAFGTTTVVLALKVSTLGNHALVAATPPATATSAPTTPPPASPTPTPSSGAGLVATSPTPGVAATPSAAPSSGAGVVPAPGDPSTTADLGSGVTMRIMSFQPGTVIVFQIYNRGSAPFVLDFETTDVTVYDDETPTRFYNVVGAGGNHVTIQASTYPYDGTNINVNGAPNANAKRWTVTFKAISGRQNVTLQYALA